MEKENLAEKEAVMYLSLKMKFHHCEILQFAKPLIKQATRIFLLLLLLPQPIQYPISHQIKLSTQQLKK
ncbi:unnamed protein product [Citrullus colocynthis]|uniref:Uncharacterized protein n=1 Tax=Citrullus colocynthis TaxID=252529 RepID=A0ABP0Z2B5_9ROSI